MRAPARPPASRPTTRASPPRRRARSLGLFQEVVEHQQPAFVRQRGVEARMRRQIGQVELAQERQRNSVSTASARRRYSSLNSLPCAGVIHEPSSSNPPACGRHSGDAPARVVPRPDRQAASARPCPAADRGYRRSWSRQGNRVLVGGGGGQHQAGRALRDQVRDDGLGQLGLGERLAQGVQACGNEVDLSSRSSGMARNAVTVSRRLAAGPDTARITQPPRANQARQRQAQGLRTQHPRVGLRVRSRHSTAAP